MVTFFFIAVLLALSPGPDNLYLLNQSLQNGKKAGVVFTLGLCSGLVVHTMLALFGIGALIIANQKLFELLKIFGALYLCYLAVMLLRQNSLQSLTKVKPLQIKKLYFQGVIMNLSNPKVLLFFITFLPQFIDSSLNFYSQIIIYGALFLIATLCVFLLIALFGDYISHYFQSKKFYKTMNLLCAGVFIFVALHLLI